MKRFSTKVHHAIVAILPALSFILTVDFVDRADFNVLFLDFQGGQFFKMSTTKTD